VIANLLILLFDVAESLWGSAASFVIRAPMQDTPDVIENPLVLLFDVAESLWGSAAPFVIRASMEAAAP
jgi:hypothetical protein